MSEGIELTIITPVRNGGRYLRECIENVAAQDTSGVEHLVVDGASTDGTGDMLKELACAHPHLRWVSEPDTGQSNAMNKGIRLARGRILGFLNVDDYYEPRVFPRVRQLFQGLKEPALVYGNCSQVDETGKFIWKFKPVAFSWMRMMTHANPTGFPINPASYFYHKTVHDQIGGYDESEHLVMDLDFLLRAARVAHLAYYDEDWGVMRWMPGTKSFDSLKDGTAREALRRVLARNLKARPLPVQATVKACRLGLRCCRALRALVSGHSE
jgi:glycosyltransferase involved in cell wall biosynthesis